MGGMTNSTVVSVCVPAGPRKRPRQARSIRLVHALKQAAREILESEGREGLCVAVLAAQARVAPSSIYKYFPTMDALIAAVFEDHRAAYRQRLLAAIEALPAQSTLFDGLVVVVESGLELLERWSRLDPALNMKAAHYDELVRLNLIQPDPFWTSRITPALLARFAHELRVTDTAKAQFLVYQTLVALPRAMVLERPQGLSDRCMPRLIARMLHALLTTPEAGVLGAAPLSR